MDIFTRIDTNILALIILAILFVKAYNPTEKMFVHQRLFLGMVLLNALIIAFDTAGWLVDTLPGGSALFFNWAVNLVLYIIIPLAPSLWILYTDYQINKSAANFKKIIAVLGFPLLANGLLSLASLWTGWYFIIADNNIYRRGDYNWVFLVLCYALILYSFFTVLFNRSKIDKRYYTSLLLFYVPYLLGASLQVLFYGVSFAWIGMMIAMFILYVNIQVSLLSTDHLTGAFNRRQLQSYLSDRIKNSVASEAFSAILLDLNDLKIINDRFGHNAGDEALKDVVVILRKSLRQNDFIARYGGDEFIVVMEMSDRAILAQAVERIQQNVAHFNLEAQKPYRLGFAMGYDIYDPHSKITCEEFIMKLDSLMYLDKNRIKQAQ